ncbi:MAG TPA: zinc ribbon domain-containing protein [Chthonomonadaceae bacterium]|nr:zinc ribbon domain-containing protein [Chthonomonadaceae bacterium]
MINTSDQKSRDKTERAGEVRAKRRALQAQIVTGLRALIEADEQLLEFARGKIAGGLRGKLTVGFEALFAPDVNVGLTERRIVLQHVQPESGRPNEILPHSFPLGEIQSIAFSDVETFGAESCGRLNIRLVSDQHFRLRFAGAENVASARRLANVFTSLTATRPRSRTSPTQSVCPHCDQVLDRVSRFCPYCGKELEPAGFGAAVADAAAPEAAGASTDPAAREAVIVAITEGGAAAPAEPGGADIGQAAGETAQPQAAEASADRPHRDWAQPEANNGPAGENQTEGGDSQ